MALGGGTNLCLVESVPAAACALREAGRHPRGVPVPRVCSDLLALPRCRLTAVLRTISWASDSARPVIAVVSPSHSIFDLLSGICHVKAERIVVVADEHPSGGSLP